MPRNPAADMTVQIVGDNADQKVQVVGDQVITATAADAGKVVTVEPDGTLGLETPSGGSALTIKDEGSDLATAATSIDFVGAGVTATGAGAGKTVTIPGASAAFPTYTGDGNPEGVQAGAVNETYGDNAGALYLKMVAEIAADPTKGWAQILGVSDAPPYVPGLSMNNVEGRIYLLGHAGFVLSDAVAQVGSGNCLQWNSPGADGDQNLSLYLGPDAAFNWYFRADGNSEVPGDFTFTAIGTGPVVKSPNGTLYRLKVANDGTLSTEAV